jgi:hydroxypyruvate isomerase
MTPGFNEHMGHPLPYAANCSLLFTEVALVERPAAAHAAGFAAIEFWWPWPDQPVPPEAEIDRFVAAVRDAGVQLIGLNFFAGDLEGADCGVLSIPARSAEFRDNIAATMSIGEALGVPTFNALYGNRVDDASAAGRSGNREPAARSPSSGSNWRHGLAGTDQRAQAVSAPNR